ncbi:MAG: hypothetical protein BGO12_10810 [Verrucomicrobia bacterium 61-8]|nr:MAG: hypothetical protein BGO12_10810 [Verrucomicrobia bacterium 61-8]
MTCAISFTTFVTNFRCDRECFPNHLFAFFRSAKLIHYQTQIAQIVSLGKSLLCKPRYFQRPFVHSSSLSKVSCRTMEASER